MIDTGSEQPRFPMQGIVQPTRDEVLSLPGIHVSQHPVMAHKLTALRNKSTLSPEFYRLVKEIGECWCTKPPLAWLSKHARRRRRLVTMQGYKLAGGIGITLDIACWPWTG